MSDLIKAPVVTDILKQAIEFFTEEQLEDINKLLSSVEPKDVEHLSIMLTALETTSVEYKETPDQVKPFADEMYGMLMSITPGVDIPSVFQAWIEKVAQESGAEQAAEAHIDELPWKLFYGLMNGDKAQGQYIVSEGAEPLIGHELVSTAAIPADLLGQITNYLIDRIINDPENQPDVYTDILKGADGSDVRIVLKEVKINLDDVSDIRLKNTLENVQRIKQLFVSCPNGKLPWEEGFHPEANGVVFELM